MFVSFTKTLKKMSGFRLGAIACLTLMGGKICNGRILQGHRSMRVQL